MLSALAWIMLGVFIGVIVMSLMNMAGSEDEMGVKLDQDGEDR